MRFFLVLQKHTIVVQQSREDTMCICDAEDTQRSSSKRLIELIKCKTLCEISWISTSPCPNFLQYARTSVSLIHLLPCSFLPRFPFDQTSTAPFPPSPLFLPPTPPPLLSLVPPSLLLCSMYSRILMWPVRELVKLSQLCAVSVSEPHSSHHKQSIPLDLSSSLYVDKWTEPGFSFNILHFSPRSCCFLWSSSDHRLLWGFGSRLNWIRLEGC